MSGMNDTGKTIGEVEKLTGIPKRTLKYFIEQQLVQPSEKSESGYWLYRREDIQRAQFVALCRELDFPNRAIRSILVDPARRWPRELEQQILRLSARQERLEAQLARAEALLRSWPEAEWDELLTVTKHVVAAAN